MKNILIFSDSHGNSKDIFDVINKNIETDLIIFAGDGINQIEDLKILYPNIEIKAVNGNNDFYTEYLDEELILVENKKIFITHGHRYRVKNTDDDIIRKSSEIGADIFVYGHTHEARIEYINNVLFLNPGSIGYTPNTYISLKLDSGKVIDAKIKYAG